MSGLIPIFMKPDIADPIQFDAVIGTPEAGAVTAEADDEDDANPGVKGIEAGAAADPPDVPATSAGTAASRALMPGTVFSTCAKSSGFINDFAIVKEIGANVVRFAHYQHSQYTYDKADQAGLVTWAENAFVNRINDTLAFAVNTKQ